jgi:hypothetical protein
MTNGKHFEMEVKYNLVSIGVRILQTLIFQMNCRFRRNMRMSRNNFANLLGLIEKDPIFHTNTNKQHPVIVQLAVTLFRLGIFGNSASIQNVAKEFGISDGGAVSKMTERIITAILSLKDELVSWPTAEERVKISNQLSCES